MQFRKKLGNYDSDLIDVNKLIGELQGWFGYAYWANTRNIRENMINQIIEKFNIEDGKIISKLYKAGKIM